VRAKTTVENQWQTTISEGFPMKHVRTFAATSAAIAFLLLGLSITSTAQATVKAGTGSQLLWAEDFNYKQHTGSSGPGFCTTPGYRMSVDYPDTCVKKNAKNQPAVGNLAKTWTQDLGFNDTGNGNWGNAEWEVYTTHNDRTQGMCTKSGYKVSKTDQRVCEKRGAKNLAATGVLNIFTKPITDWDSFDTALCGPERCTYYSARINTKDKLYFKYGKIEAKIWMPKGNGAWPAFWMLGKNIDVQNIGWPKCGELDIVEINRNQNRAVGSFHSPSTPPGSGYTRSSDDTGVALNEGWHTYGVIWTSSSVSWTLDGEVFNSMSKDSGFGWKGILDQPYFLILNLAMGGTFVGGQPDSDLDSRMLVDWIHYSKYNGEGTLYNGAGKVIKK